MLNLVLVTAALVIQAQADAPQDAPVETPQLSISSQAGVRCAAAFALVSYGQENGNAEAMQWPQIDPRGREYFVQTLARVMDETGIDREQASDLVESEAKRLLDTGELEAVMPSCLALLESSGL